MIQPLQKDNQQKQMDREIKVISSFRSLVLSRILLNIALIVSSVVLTFYGYRNPSPLYLLFILNVAPSIVAILLRSRFSGQKPAVQFPALTKKYRYSLLAHMSTSITFYFIYLLILLWHFSFLPDTHWTTMIPIGCLVLCVVSRLILNLALPFVIKRRLMLGKF